MKELLNEIDGLQDGSLMAHADGSVSKVNKETREKIEEILRKYIRADVEDKVGCAEFLNRELVKELSTLIQEERKKDREMIYKDIQANYHITADEFYKHYLQSLDKGGE
jgi:intergrase/recombinase